MKSLKLKVFIIFNLKNNYFRGDFGDKPRRRKRKELSNEQKNEIKEAFELFDSDKDQRINYHELKVNETFKFAVIFYTV